jgi:hypothetical protein
LNNTGSLSLPQYFGGVNSNDQDRQRQTSLKIFDSKSDEDGFELAGNEHKSNIHAMHSRMKIKSQMMNKRFLNKSL